MIADLDVVAEDLVKSGVRKSTARAYSSAQAQFLSFCQSLRLCPIPTSERTILTFMAYMYKKGLSHASMNVYLSGIRNLNVINGYDIPQVRSPKVKLALKAVLERSAEPLKKSPITWELLQKMWPVVESSKDTHLWQAVLSLAFFGGMRCAEYAPSTASEVCPRIKDVTFTDSGKVMKYKVHKSKTRTHGFVCQLACSENKICATCCMLNYISIRSKMYRISKSSYLFVNSQGQQLCSAHVNKFIKSTIKALGLNEKCYSAHSIRSGAASTAALSGFSEWEIKKLGGWKTSIYSEYIRNVQSHTLQFSKRLARANNTDGLTS